METTYYIRIPNQDDRVKAIGVFLEIPSPRSRFPDNVMGVTLAHIQALQREGIPFEMASGKKWNGPAAAPIQQGCSCAFHSSVDRLKMS